jgi:hypothetical protein
MKRKPITNGFRTSGYWSSIVLVVSKYTASFMMLFVTGVQQYAIKSWRSAVGCTTYGYVNKWLERVRLNLDNVYCNGHTARYRDGAQAAPVLRKGDLVDVEISKIGMIANHVIEQ